MHPKGDHGGGQYLVLEGAIEASEAWVARPAPILEGGRTFADELVRMLGLEAGRTFFDVPCNCAAHGWSQTVWDILDSSVGSVFRRRNTFSARQPRRVGSPIRAKDGIAFLTGGALHWPSLRHLGFQRGTEVDGEGFLVPDGPEEIEGSTSVIVIETESRTEAEVSESLRRSAEPGVLLPPWRL